MSVRHKRRARRTWLIGVAASGLFAGLAIVGVPAQATSVGNLFELDGNPQLSATTAGDDWETLYNTSDANDPLGTFVTSTSMPIADGDSNSSTPDTSYFTGGGSKDVRDVSSWRHSTGDVAPDKDEILNAFAAAYKADTDDADTDEELIVFFGADRFANDGDAQMGFWFFKNNVTKKSDGTFSGVHANGDILVLSDFSGGGKVSTMTAYTWDNGKLKALNLSNSVVDCSATHNADLCATENGSTVDSLWSYQPKGAAADKYPIGSFLEGGINVSHLLPTTDGCFASFLAETRSSTSTSAQLKDFALGGFPVCASSTSLNDTAATADPTVAHSDEPVDLTFYESNDGETRLSNANLTSTDSACNDSMVYVSGNTNDDAYLDPGEEWLFTCTTSSDAAGTTVTIDATGHGTNPSGKDVTYWTVDDVPCTEGEVDSGRLCDLEEYTTVDFDVINPSTTLTKTASAEVTYTYKEKNDGNGDIDNVVVTDDNCTDVVPTELDGYNVGDSDQDGVLNTDEEWTFTCTATINGSAPAEGETVGTSVTNTATATGDDGTGAEVTWCEDAEAPPTDTYCSQGEQDSVTVTITEHAGVLGQ